MKAEDEVNYLLIIGIRQVIQDIWIETYLKHEKKKKIKLI